MNPVATALAQDFAQQVLAQVHPDEQLETFVQSNATTKVQFQANKLKDATAREARGIGVRLRTADGRVGTFATSDFQDPAGVLEMARNLAALSEPMEYEIPKQYAPTPVDAASPEYLNLSAERMTADGARLIERLVAELPEALHGTELYQSVTSFELANSFGASARYTHAEYNGYVVSSVTRPDDQLEAYEILQSAEGRIDLDGPFQRLAAKIQWAMEPAQLASGAFPVLFTPNALSTFFALGNALNGKPVVEGISTLRDALGQQALSPLLTMMDDPTVPGGPQSYPLDDEGIPSSQTILINRGVVQAFIFDLRYGAKSGVGSTGNGLRCGRTNIGAGRGYSNSVSPASSNTIIEAGTTAVSDMIRGMSKGLIVDSVMGVHTCNPISGDFSVNMDLALVVENGEVVGRLKDAMLSGNTFALLKDRLQAVSSERVWLGSALVPYFLVDGLDIATAG